jgi:hypothetical protein
MTLGVVFRLLSRRDSSSHHHPARTEEEMTGLLILDAVLCTAIVVVIVGMLAFAIVGDRRVPVMPKLRAAARSGSSVPQVAVSLAPAK